MLMILFLLGVFFYALSGLLLTLIFGYIVFCLIKEQNKPIKIKTNKAISTYTSYKKNQF